MADYVSLSSRLKDRSKEFGAADKEWVRYVYDHYSYLKSISTPHRITTEHMYAYEHRPDMYLKVIHYLDGAGWIVLFVNQLSGNAAFSRLTEILLPDQAKLSAMRDQFLTYQKELNEASGMLAATTAPSM